MSKLHFGGHALRIARIRLLRDYQQAGIPRSAGAAAGS